MGADVGVWPLPRSVQFSGPPSQLHSDFTLESSSSSAVLDHAHNRLKASLGASSAGFTIVKVTLDSEDEYLGARTDYSYSLKVLPEGIWIHGGSVYGAMYGLETLSQLVDADGSLPHNTITIDDVPDWSWRGVRIDAGRRFFPVPLVKNILDTMATVKMNVLHLHASDHCRFAVESKVVPNLTDALTGDYAGHYTQDDIKDLIAYAQLRGIRVVPEFDIPGHSRGWLPAQSSGVQFCTDGPYQNQLYNDPENKTRDVVAAVFKEMAELFTDEVFHIGADETSKRGVCSVTSTFDFEQEILHIVEGYGKTVTGWEELYFDVHAGMETAIINTWSRHTAHEVTATGRKAIENKHDHFYFTRPAPGGPSGWTPCWYDIGTGVPDDERSLLLGGEVSMWTDTYLESSQCGAYSGGAQVAGALFPPTRDVEFGKSIGGMMWPRGFVAAQAFWHYNSSLDPASDDFVAGIWAINEKITNQGGLVCPTNCSCDQLSACGMPYIAGFDETYQEHPGQVLHHYPSEFDVNNLPYENSLVDAEAWCNSRSDCGGITLTDYNHAGDFIYEARSSNVPQASDANETSFVKVCPCTYAKVEGQVIKYYPTGFSVDNLPYTNDLASAEAWCNARLDCGGVTLTEWGHTGTWIYEARSNRAPVDSPINETSFVKSCPSASVGGLGSVILV